MKTMARAEKMLIGEEKGKGRSAICSQESIHDGKSQSVVNAARGRGAMTASTFLVSEIFVDFENNNQRCV